MQEPAIETRTIAGLHTDVFLNSQEPDAPTVVLLHGYDGFAADLSPFARSFRLPLRFAFPQAPGWAAAGGRGGHAWWDIDDEGRAEALASGVARDLSGVTPAGLDAARAQVNAFLDELTRTWQPRTLVIGGFSQGAMLTGDLTLRGERPLSGLALLSGARICADAWAPLYARRRGLPVYLSHGDADRDLAFAAAERFQADLRESGWIVSWVPFEGGHEVPLIALRSLKRFLAATLDVK